MPTSDYLSLNILVKQIGEWGDKAFPNASLGSCMAHFEEEFSELGDEIALAEDEPIDREAIAEELADCFLLISHLAHKVEIDLADAVVDKLARNQARRFAYDPALGYARHVEE